MHVLCVIRKQPLKSVSYLYSRTASSCPSSPGSPCLGPGGRCVDSRYRKTLAAATMAASPAKERMLPPSLKVLRPPAKLHWELGLKAGEEDGRGVGVSVGPHRGRRGSLTGQQAPSDGWHSGRVRWTDHMAAGDQQLSSGREGKHTVDICVTRAHCRVYRLPGGFLTLFFSHFKDYVFI